MTTLQEAYLKERFEQYVQLLREWLSIPSISTLAEHAGDVRRAAEWVVRRLTVAGWTDVQLKDTEGIPWFLPGGVMIPDSQRC